MIIEPFSLDVTVEALRAKIDRKSAISLQKRPILGRRGRPLPIIFARLVRPVL